jgi:hypothetical protein
MWNIIRDCRVVEVFENEIDATKRCRELNLEFGIGIYTVEPEITVEDFDGLRPLRH